jgi:fumarate hydratase subunit alpha
VKEIRYQESVEKVKEMCKKANFNLGDDVYTAFKRALK